MRKKPYPPAARIINGIPLSMRTTDADGMNGAFWVGNLRCIVSDGGGWDHVSVSLPDRCPTWQEMQRARACFWRDDEWVVQYSPAVTSHINYHQSCLHWWKPQNETMPTPPPEFVGVPETAADRDKLYQRKGRHR